jgi:hypothetical protein
MTLYEFNLLSENDQAEVVWSGSHIGERTENEYEILLYQVDGFYVEVFYHKEQNQIVRFRSFSSLNQLNPYLEQIDLKRIL